MAVTNPVSQRQSGRSNGGDVPPFERGPAPSHADEAGIIARCVAGGRKAYGVLVDRYKQLVHDLVHRMVGDAPQAEDIAQDAFVKAFVSIRQFRGDARFSTWVCRIAINRCKDVLRRQAREPRATAALDGAADPTADIPDGGETPALALERHEQEDLLRRALARLPAKYREDVVRLFRAAARPQVPSPSFTEEVLARLPERTPGAWERLWEFVWTPRLARWNVASALALGMILIAIAVVGRGLPGSLPAAPEPRPVVTLFRFSLQAPGAERVSLAGDFNGWRTDEIFLADVTGRGQFSVTLPLTPGRYAYMFVVDGTTWVTDPRADAYRDDGFGNRNAVVTIDAAGSSHDQS